MRDRSVIAPAGPPRPCTRAVPPVTFNAARSSQIFVTPLLEFVCAMFITRTQWLSLWPSTPARRGSAAADDRGDVVWNRQHDMLFERRHARPLAPAGPRRMPPPPPPQTRAGACERVGESGSRDKLAQGVCSLRVNITKAWSCMGRAHFIYLVFSIPLLLSSRRSSPPASSFHAGPILRPCARGGRPRVYMMCHEERARAQAGTQGVRRCRLQRARPGKPRAKCALRCWRCTRNADGGRAPAPYDGKRMSCT
ncbi:hypothetical protein EVAR_37141_1 [Eumeta japonica]|uniref:Uncharacterized protein n=1 Tax=Eumeta variegata TaxID=151549 RepID=A0A4C1XQN5_EUMVA|nr:hypothetical protein EVAR_37141_1 [Eumeta japonica]